MSSCQEVGSRQNLCEELESEEEPPASHGAYGGSSATKKGSASAKRGATSLNMTSRSGSPGDGTLAKRGAASLSMTPSSGSAAGHSATSLGMTSRSGLHFSAERGDAPIRMTSQSGSQGEHLSYGSTSKFISSPSGLRLRGVANEASAAGAMPRSSTAEGPERCGERREPAENFSGVGSEAVTPKEGTPNNPWNKFQKDHAGKGLSKKTMSQIYQFQKKRGELT